MIKTTQRFKLSNSILLDSILISSQKAVACFLHDNYVFALFVPAAIVLFGNLGVTITAVYIAHR